MKNILCTGFVLLASSLFADDCQRFLDKMQIDATTYQHVSSDNSIAFGVQMNHSWTDPNERYQWQTVSLCLMMTNHIPGSRTVGDCVPHADKNHEHHGYRGIYMGTSPRGNWSGDYDWEILYRAYSVNNVLCTGMMPSLAKTRLPDTGKQLPPSLTQATILTPALISGDTLKIDVYAESHSPLCSIGTGGNCMGSFAYPVVGEDITGNAILLRRLDAQSDKRFWISGGLIALRNKHYQFQVQIFEQSLADRPKPNTLPVGNYEIVALPLVDIFGNRQVTPIPEEGRPTFRIVHAQKREPLSLNETK